MPSPTQLVSGVGGAIGCDFRKALNQLVFVEYAGKLSRLNLFRSATVVKSGTAVLKGTFTFDLDTGVEGGAGPGNDIWWDQQTTVVRQMVPQNAARIVHSRADEQAWVVLKDADHIVEVAVDSHRLADSIGVGKK